MIQALHSLGPPTDRPVEPVDSGRWSHHQAVKVGDHMTMHASHMSIHPSHHVDVCFISNASEIDACMIMTYTSLCCLRRPQLSLYLTLLLFTLQ